MYKKKNIKYTFTTFILFTKKNYTIKEIYSKQIKDKTNEEMKEIELVQKSKTLKIL